MTDEQNIAYVMSQTTCANILALGMVEENKKLIQNNQPVKYGYEDFERLNMEYGLYHNQVLTQLLGR